MAVPLKVFILAGDCERTLRSALVVKEGGQLRTIFRPRKLKLKGTGLTLSEVEGKLFEPGDGRITRRSALAFGRGYSVADKSVLSVAIFGCGIHGDLPNNLTFQDNLLSILHK